jgi:hypothetical protein
VLACRAGVVVPGKLSWAGPVLSRWVGAAALRQPARASASARSSTSACTPAILLTVAGRTRCSFSSRGGGWSLERGTGTLVSLSTSMAPGPAARQQGTWEAPKCPPHAHSLRLRAVVCA